MELSHRTDAALLELARQGSAPAFAAILHRHADTVHRSIAHTGDSVSAVQATFLDAMRQLGSLDADVDAALQDLAVAHGGVRDPGSSAGRDLTEEEIDGIWSALAPRWPSGRSRPRLSQAVPGIALVVLLIGVGFVVPRLVITPGDEPPGEELEHLVARPYEEEDEEDEEPTDTVEDPEIPLLPIPDGDGPDPLDDTQESTTSGDDQVPADATEPPAGDSDASADGTTAPADDAQTPGGDTTTPADDTTTPADDTTAPAGDTTAPAGDTSVGPPTDDSPPQDGNADPASPDDAPPGDGSGTQDGPVDAGSADSDDGMATAGSS